MAFRLRPYPLSGVALAFVLALVIAAQSWGDRPQETPRAPPPPALPGREKAPAAATADMFAGMDFTQASTSGISVGVPGTLLGVATALRSWGTVSLADALQPAIKLAEQGFAINAFLAAASASFRTTLQPETRALFRRPDGSPLQAGDLLVQPDLARTFRLIAAQGPDVLYRGEIARAILAAQQRTRVGPIGAGRMTLA